MNNKAKLLTFATVTVTVFAVTLGTVIAQTKLTSQVQSNYQWYWSSKNRDESS